MQVLFLEDCVRVAGGAKVREVAYHDIESWVEDAPHELFSFRGGGKEVELVSRDAVQMREQLVAQVNTTEWTGHVSGTTGYAERGPTFTVMKLPLGTQASVEFKAEVMPFPPPPCDVAH